MTTSSPVARRAAFWLAILGLLLFLHHGDPLSSDDGLVLAGAWDMWLGRLIYRDFFVWTAPGSYYTVWALWSLVGPSYAAAKMVGITSVLLSAWAIVRTAELFSEGRRIYLVAALYVLMSAQWPIVSYNVLSIPFVAWAVYFAARGCLDRRPISFALAGACSGFGTLYLQHRGIAVAGGTALFCIVQACRSGSRWIRSLGWFVAGFLPPLLLLLRWDISLIGDALFIFPWERYQPDATHRGPFVTYVSIWVIVLGVAWMLRSRMTKAAAYVLTIQALLLALAYRSWDWGHISFSLFPLFTIVAALEWSVPPQAAVSRLVWQVLVATYYAMLAGITTISALYAMLTIERVGDARDLPLAQFVDRHCTGSELWAGPFIPGMYFYTRRTNPTRFSTLVARQNRPEDVAEARDVLERVRPPCAVVNYRVGSQWHTRDNAVDQFLASQYRPAFAMGDTVVMSLAEPGNLSYDGIRP